MMTKLITTWFGSGSSKFAPGTMGSLATLPIAYAIHAHGGFISLLVFAMSAFIIGIVATEFYLAEHPEKSDPSEIVIDEVAGQSLLLCILAPTLPAYLLGFILFRLFDILKPWPICMADKKVKNGLGVMLDDVIAALIAIALLVILYVASVDIPALSFATPYLSPLLNVS